MHESLPPSEDWKASRLICGAIRSRTPLAVSKFGFSEQAMILLPTLFEGNLNVIQERAISAALLTHGSAQGGLFPPSIPEILDFAALFRSSLFDHDVLASFESKWFADCQAKLPQTILYPDVDALDVRWAGVHHPLQRILDSLNGRRVLLVTSPADFLLARAKPEIFEGVWSSCDRQWFSPLSIEGLEIPNIFDADVRAAFGSTVEYVESIVDQLRVREFDVALVGASLCGPVLASEVKKLGKVGISLGSQLQLLFGVHGKRWYDWKEFQELVVNAAWTILPESYRPRYDGFHADGGAYWA